jgi:gliding motility-associated lipoprotein GldH
VAEIKIETASQQKMNKLLAFFLLTVIFVSCETNTIFSETRAMEGHWGADEVVEFKLPQLDSLKNYNLFLNIRNTNEYKFNNIFLIVSMNFPQGKTVTDTLEYRMANPDGTWMGQGIGNVKENKMWYKESVPFFEEGNYTITIAQAMRNNGDVEGVTKLEGITDVGFSIEEATKQ